jgi:hypothetical protein
LLKNLRFLLSLEVWRTWLRMRRLLRLARTDDRYFGALRQTMKHAAINGLNFPPDEVARTMDFVSRVDIFRMARAIEVRLRPWRYNKPLKHIPK